MSHKIQKYYLRITMAVFRSFTIFLIGIRVSVGYYLSIIQPMDMLKKQVVPEHHQQ